MASTTALFSGLSGLNANARNLDVIGNNIANVNTTAFKGSRLLFATQFSRTMNMGSTPGENTGGTNPFQVGLGVVTAGTQKNFGSGSLSTTGDPRDMAIEGDGFFIVRRGEQELYTRAGAFRTNSRNELVTITGERLRGFGVDEQFNIQSGTLTDVRIPLGQLTLAEATRNVVLAGNLDADGPLPTAGSTVLLRGTSTAGLRSIPGAVPPPSGTNLLEQTTRLVDIEDPLLPSSGTSLFAAGQTLELRGAEKGTRTLPTAQFAITATTTIADLETFLTQAMGIDTSIGANPDGQVPGVRVDPATGEIRVVGNAGSVNDLILDSTDLRLLDGAGQFVRTPMTATKTGEAGGESVRTTFVVFDSLGAPVEVDVTLALDSRSNTGSTWRWFVESGDAAGTPLQMGTGLVRFDTQGQLIDDAPAVVTIDRSGGGAASPLAFNLFFAGGEEGVTSLASDRSQVAANFRDGSPIGTLSGFAVGRDGVILGSFTNGLVRTLGQVPLATFTNNEGLVDLGNNMYAVGANSGTAVVTSPGDLGAGQLVNGALELSNVDLGEEFIKMILSSTGYSASSRVIRTTDELMQQLLVIGR